MKLFKKESLIRGSALSVVFNAIAKLLQVVNIFSVSIFFGANNNTDLFYFLLNLITITIAGFISGMDATVIIPEFMRRRENVDLKKAMGFINKYVFIYLIIGVLFCCLGSIEPLKIYSTFSKFDVDTLTGNKVILILCLPLLGLMLTTNLLSNVLMSHRYFTLPSIVNLINNFFSLFFLFLFFRQLKLVSILVGMLLGYFINLLILCYILKVKLKWRFGVVDWKFEKRIFRFISNSQIVALIVSGRTYLTQFLLSGLSGGTLTAINWGGQISSIPETFINSQVYNVMGVKFSEDFARNEVNKSIDLFRRVFFILLIVTGACITFLFLCSTQIASLLNFRNKVSGETMDILVRSIKYLSLIPFINIITFLVSKLLAATQKISFRFVVYSFIGQVALLALIVLLVGTNGYLGYIMATVLGFSIIALLNFLLMGQYFNFAIVKRTALSFFYVLFSLVVLVMIVRYIDSVLHMSSRNTFAYVFFVLVVVFIFSFLNLKKHVSAFRKSL